MEWLVGVAVVAVVGGYVIAMYNRLIGLSRRVEEAWNDIQHQMKRRDDAILRLVEWAKGHVGQEDHALDTVTRAHEIATATFGGPAQRARSESRLQAAVHSLLDIAKSRSEHRADAELEAVKRDVAEAESRIQAARRSYNGNVRELNVTVERFPSRLIARQFGFRRAEFFHLEEAGAQAPRASR